MTVASWQRNQGAQKSTSATPVKKPSAIGATLSYMYKPRIGRNIGEIGRSLGLLPRILAYVFAGQKLFPHNHPALRDDTMRITMREVIGTAYNNLRWDREGAPQVLFFIAVVASLAFSAIAFAFVFMGFFAGKAHAGIFDNVLGAADMSNKWLTYLFQTDVATPDLTLVVPNDTANGTVNQVIGNNVPTAFRALAAMYSTAMLFLAALILIYHLISMVVHTAHDGRVMGKSAHQVWAPIRLIFALGLLIPVANGFSSGQWLVLQIAKLGSNLASNVWADPNVGARVTGTPNVFTAKPDLDATQIIDTLVNVGYCAKSVQIKGGNTPDLAGFLGPFTTARTVANAANVADIDNALLYNNAGQPAQLAAVVARRNPVVAGSGVSAAAGANSKVYYPVSPDGGGGYTMSFDTNPCGSVVFPSFAQDGAVAANDAAYSAILQGIADAHVAAFNAIEQAALQIGATDFIAHEYGGECLATPNSGFAANCANSQGVNVSASKAFLVNGPGMYRATFQAALPAGVVLNADGKLVYTNTPGAAQATALAGACGWMCASGWFSSLASKHNAFGKSAQMVPSLRANCDSADCGEEVIKAQQEQEQKTLAAALVDRISQIDWNPIHMLSNLGMGVLRFVGLANNNNNFIWHTQFTSASPVSDMIGLGSILVDGAVHCLIIGVVLNLMGGVGAMANKVGDLVNNTGGTLGGGIAAKALKFMPVARVMNLIAGTLGGVMQFGAMLSPLFFGLATMLFVPGVFLFYLLPFLPFINFITGVITWLISLLQAVVAIPVIAIAHITPHGEGLPSGSARGAYTMILQIFLRPVMMIFGMLATVMIMNTGIGFLNVVFLNIYKTNLLGNADGLLSNIVFMGLYTAACWGIVQAAITAIDDFPLKAVTWIGGGQGVDHNHDFGGVSQLVAGAVAQQGMSAVSNASRSISAAPMQGISNAASANQGANAAAASAQAQQRMGTQLGNIQMQNAGHMGATSGPGLNAQAQGNASIMQNPGGSAGAGRGAPPPMTPPGGGGGGGPPQLPGGGSQPRLGGPGGSGAGGGSLVPAGGGGGGANANGANLGGGVTRMTPAESAAARTDGRTIDMPGSGGRNVTNTGFTRPPQGGVSTGAAGAIRSAAASLPGPAVIRTGRAGFQDAVAAARAAGHPHPEIAAAQWALESGYGRSQSGTHNYFGIKARAGQDGTMRTTHEHLNGRDVVIQDRFRNFATPAEGFQGLTNLMNNQRYASVVNAGSLSDAASALQRSGYATDPNYANKLIQTMRSNGVDVGASSMAQAPSGIEPSAGGDTGGGSSGGGLSGAAHTVLGLASFVPGLSVVTGGIDALIYTAEGDYGNAALAGVSMIPGGKWGTTGFKLARMGARMAKGAGSMARLERGMNALGGNSGGSGGGGRPADEPGWDPYSAILAAGAIRYIAQGKKGGDKPTA